MLSAAKCILPDSLVSYVLLADDCPALLSQLFSPILMHYTSYGTRVVFIAAVTLVSFILVATGGSYGLVGVVLVSLCFGIGETTFLGLSSFFDSNAVSGFSSGTGFVYIRCLYILEVSNCASCKARQVFLDLDFTSS